LKLRVYVWKLFE
jgi:hypothetical protein